MNAHALALTSMLGLGDGESGDRLRYTVTANRTNIPPLYGLQKDHKTSVVTEQGVEEGLKRPRQPYEENFLLTVPDLNTPHR